MAKDPEMGYKMVATVTNVKGKCNAGHTVGEGFEISCPRQASAASSTIRSFPTCILSISEDASPGGSVTA